MNQNSNFQVGAEVVFRNTSGDCTISRSYGTILAIGTQCRMFQCADACTHVREEGAVIAWRPEAGELEPVTVWKPFWNQRLSALPEPQLAATTRNRRNGGGR